jgi:hypothetical protein
MLTFDEAKENTQTIAMPSYGEPEMVGEDEDFLFYKISIPKILITCAAGGCGGCGSGCDAEESDGK